MNTPVVSIIVPVYNREGIISASIQSCVDQEFRDIEILIIDDGSTDATPEVLKKWQARDKRVKVFTNAESKGASYSRNVGINNATGKYINFLDSDDILFPSKLKTELAFFVADDSLDVVVSLAQYLGEEGNLVIHKEIKYHEDLIEEFIRKEIKWFTQIPLWKKEFLNSVGYFNEGVTVGDDYEFYSRLVIGRPNVAYGDTVLSEVISYDLSVDRHKLRSEYNSNAKIASMLKARFYVLLAVVRGEIPMKSKIATTFYLMRVGSGLVIKLFLNQIEKLSGSGQKPAY